jgi:hypothetical protein
MKRLAVEKKALFLCGGQLIDACPEIAKFYLLLGADVDY